MTGAWDLFGPFLFWTLVAASWSAALLLGIVWALLRSMRRTSAAFRSLAWNLALGCTVVLPVALVFVPLPRIPLHPVLRGFGTIPAGHSAAFTPGGSRVESISSQARPMPGVNSAQPRLAPFDWETAIKALAACWLVGVAVTFGRSAAGHLLLGWLAPATTLRSRREPRSLPASLKRSRFRRV